MEPFLEERYSRLAALLEEAQEAGDGALSTLHAALLQAEGGLGAPLAKTRKRDRQTHEQLLRGTARLAVVPGAEPMAVDERLARSISALSESTGLNEQEAAQLVYPYVEDERWSSEAAAAAAARERWLGRSALAAVTAAAAAVGGVQPGGQPAGAAGRCGHAVRRGAAGVMPLPLSGGIPGAADGGRSAPTAGAVSQPGADERQRADGGNQSARRSRPPHGRYVVGGRRCHSDVVSGGAVAQCGVRGALRAERQRGAGVGGRMVARSVLAIGTADGGAADRRGVVAAVHRGRGARHRRQTVASGGAAGGRRAVGRPRCTTRFWSARARQPAVSPGIRSQRSAAVGRGGIGHVVAARHVGDGVGASGGDGCNNPSVRKGGMVLAAGTTAVPSVAPGVARGTQPGAARTFRARVGRQCDVGGLVRAVDPIPAVDGVRRRRRRGAVGCGAGMHGAVVRVGGDGDGGGGGATSHAARAGAVVAYGGDVDDGDDDDATASARGLAAAVHGVPATNTRRGCRGGDTERVVLVANGALSVQCAANRSNRGRPSPRLTAGAGVHRCRSGRRPVTSAGTRATACARRGKRGGRASIHRAPARPKDVTSTSLSGDAYMAQASQRLRWRLEGAADMLYAVQLVGALFLIAAPEASDDAAAVERCLADAVEACQRGALAALLVHTVPWIGQQQCVVLHRSEPMGDLYADLFSDMAMDMAAAGVVHRLFDAEQRALLRGALTSAAIGAPATAVASPPSHASYSAALLSVQLIRVLAAAARLCPDNAVRFSTEPILESTLDVVRWLGDSCLDFQDAVEAVLAERENQRDGEQGVVAGTGEAMLAKVPFAVLLAFLELLRHAAAGAEPVASYMQSGGHSVASLAALLRSMDTYVRTLQPMAAAAAAAAGSDGAVFEYMPRLSPLLPTQRAEEMEAFAALVRAVASLCAHSPDTADALRAEYSVVETCAQLLVLPLPLDAKAAVAEWLLALARSSAAAAVHVERCLQQRDAWRAPHGAQYAFLYEERDTGTFGLSSAMMSLAVTGNRASLAAHAEWCAQQVLPLWERLAYRDEAEAWRLASALSALLAAALRPESGTSARPLADALRRPNSAADTATSALRALLAVAGHACDRLGTGSDGMPEIETAAVHALECLRWLLSPSLSLESKVNADAAARAALYTTVTRVLYGGVFPTTPPPYSTLSGVTTITVVGDREDEEDESAALSLPSSSVPSHPAVAEAVARAAARQLSELSPPLPLSRTLQQLLRDAAAEGDAPLRAAALACLQALCALEVPMRAHDIAPPPWLAVSSSSSSSSSAEAGTSLSSLVPLADRLADAALPAALWPERAPLSTTDAAGVVVRLAERSTTPPLQLLAVQQLYLFEAVCSALTATMLIADALARRLCTETALLSSWARWCTVVGRGRLLSDGRNGGWSVPLLHEEAAMATEAERRRLSVA
eukprot:ctg_91.g22